MYESEVKYKELLDSLEKKVQEGSVAFDDLMELGHVYLYFDCDYDKEHAAVRIFERAMQLYPTEIITKVWLADTLLNLAEGPIHAERAIKLADEIINAGGELAAAGYSLKVWAIDAKRKYREKENIEETINLLKKAAEIAPSWPTIHYGLFYRYKRIGKYEEAISEVQLAIDNIIDPIHDSSLSRIHYESLITGRWGKHWTAEYERYISELQELIEKKRKDSEMKMSNPPVKREKFQPTRLWRSIIKIFRR